MQCFIPGAGEVDLPFPPRPGETARLGLVGERERFGELHTPGADRRLQKKNRGKERGGGNCREEQRRERKL